MSKGHTFRAGKNYINLIRASEKFQLGRATQQFISKILGAERAWRVARAYEFRLRRKPHEDA